MTNDDEPQFWFSACLRIKDAPELHGEIIENLGHGSEHHKKGDIVPEAPDKTWSNSIWIMDAPVPEEEDISKHLKWISDYAYANIDSLKNLIEQNANIDIYIAYCCDHDHCGFGLDPDLLKIFNDLGIRLEVSIIT